MTPLSDLADELRDRIESTVWCTLATTDTAGRPRTRIVHPVWEIGDHGVVGWLGSRPTLKLRHLRATPAASLTYWDPRHRQATIDADATVHTDAPTCRRVWELFGAFDEPYGFDPQPIWPDGPVSDGFVAVRFDPRRIELFGAPPRVWVRDASR